MAKKHGGHHGGSWKVAYADFVTAMMALFMVLWLSSQDEKIKEAVARSFSNPFSTLTKQSTGIIPNKEMQAVKSSQGNFDSASAVELNMLRRLNEDLLASLQKHPDLDQDETVKLELNNDGLRISIFDRNRKPVFEPDSARFTEYGRWVFSTLAWQVARYPSFRVELEGHTEQGFKAPRDDYGPWELTTDRANTARRSLLEHGVKTPQIRKVAGYADTQPMPRFNPEDEINRRVSLMLKAANKIGQ
ncbi:MAG: chemotaxis protein MotB [Limisphaerales bacterium]|nr:MAG: chemotaxis protein MotB [Limisphaerales bacterium]KAG0507109.1 MAG: chemotaxis protein MotB [Limisphaerales bacterium]TXT49313.1 MAG: chemotaxis protein MotB [Limisphaerales bacterium]